VTAERRSESLQDVPAAITALSGEMLDELHLQGNADLAQRVPSLAFDVLSPGESTLSIRGLGTSYGLEPAVSYYLNETPLDVRTDGYTGAPDIDFFDVDRVEVLRGPQGTLYGSSSMGGAIRVLTAQPNFSAFAVNAEVGGSVMDGGGVGYLAKSAVNIPLSSNLAVRVVGGYEYVPGYVNRVIPGDFGDPHPTNDLLVQRRTNDAELTNGRIIATWKPTDALTITPSLVFSQIRAGNNSQYYTNLPDFTTAAYYPSPQSSRLTVGNLLLTYELGFAELLSSTSVLSHDVDTCAELVRWYAALYVGGMGSREQNFYNQLATRMGYGDAAREVQELYLAKRQREAAAAVPLEFIDRTSLLGPPDRIAQRMRDFAAAGVTTLSVSLFVADAESGIQTLRQVAEAFDASGTGD